jgi:hypothetical protein
LKKKNLSLRYSKKKNSIRNKHLKITKTKNFKRILPIQSKKVKLTSIEELSNQINPIHKKVKIIFLGLIIRPNDYFCFIKIYAL